MLKNNLKEKRLVFIICINDPNRQIQNHDYAQYSIKTWEYWCAKNNVDLKVLQEDELKMKFPIWNKSLIYEYGKGYDKIGVVDSDTMIRWDAPNIFEFIEEDKFYGVNDLCDLNWLMSSIEQRQKFFPDTTIDIFKYLNTGVLFFGKKYLDIFHKFLYFVIANEGRINEIDGGGKEQTLLNFFLQRSNVEIELLDPSWNLISIHKKNMFAHNWQLNANKSPYFLNYAYIWHFTGFPIEDRINVMKSTWEFIQNQYR